MSNVSNFDSPPHSVNSEDAASSGFSPGIRDRKITVTFGTGAIQSVWTDRQSMTFGTLIDKLSDTRIGKKDGDCWVPAVFSGTIRKMQFAKQIDVAVLDSDAGDTRAELADKLRAVGLAGFIHSTASHLTDSTEAAVKAYDRWRGAEGADYDEADAPGEYLKAYKGYLSRVSDGAIIEGTTDGAKKYIFRHQPIPKFRIVIPLLRPWLAADCAGPSTADWTGRYRALAKHVGVHADESCTDASRLFFLPRVKDKAALEAAEREFVDGAPLDILALAPIAKETGAPRGTRTKTERPKQGAPDREPKQAPETDSDPDRFRIGDLDLVRWYSKRGHGFEITSALKARGRAPFRNRIQGVKRHITCPFDDFHTAADDGTGTFVVDASKRHLAGMPSITDGFIALCKHSSCAGRDRLDHVKRMVELGWLTSDDLTDKRFLSKPVRELPELPDLEQPKMSGEEGRAALEVLVKDYFDALERFLERQEWRQARFMELLAEAEESEDWPLGDIEAEKKERAKLSAKTSREANNRFGKIEDALAYLRAQIAASAGIGKTLFMAAEYRRRPRLWRYSINFFAPNVKSCAAFIAAINAEPTPDGMPRAVVLTGYTYRDDDMPEPACPKHEIVAEAFSKTSSGIFKSFCNNGEEQCEFFGRCAYTKERLDKSPKVRAFPHATAVTPQTEEMKTPEPALVIFDESFIGTATKHTGVNVKKLTDPDTYRNDPDNDRESPEDHARLAGQVLELLRTVPDVPRKLLEGDAERIKARQEQLGLERAMQEKDLDDIPCRLRRAARAAEEKGQLADIRPSDDAETVRAKLAAITGDSQGKAVAAMLRQLASDTEGGWPDSLGVQFVQGQKDNDGKKTGKDRIFVHGLRKLAFGKDAPLILIDADAIREVNEIIFGRPMRWEEIRCKRRGHVTQAKGFLGSTSTLAPSYETEGADNARYAKQCLAEIGAFAGGLAADGAKVFVAATKEVRLALTSEKPDDTGKFQVSYRDRRGFDISHNGMTIGRNIWHRHTAVIQLGREEPPCNAVEDIARAIYADARGYGFEPLKLPGSYIRMRRRRFPGSDDFVEMNAHPDPRVQAILELKRERASAQNIDRIRLLFPDDRRCRVFVLCELPLPGFVPDRVDTLSNILAGGTRMVRAAIGGLVTTNAKVMAGVHRHLYETEEAAKHDIKQANLAQALDIQESGDSPNKEDSIWGTATFAKIKDLAPIHVPGRFRIVTGPVPPKWSGISSAPSRFRRPDLTILNAVEAPAMSEIKFDGDIAVTVVIAQRQDAAGDRIADLTRPDTEPTPEEGAAFRAAALEFYDALDADARVPGPDWWTKPAAAGKLSAISEKPVPAGRMFHVTYPNASGVTALLWWFPDVVGGVFLDQLRNPIEPSPELRAAVERAVPARTAADDAEARRVEAVIDAAYAKADAELAAAAKKAGPL
jgi:hypothetical protein